MNNQKIVYDIVIKCGLKAKFRSFEKNMENYIVDNISLDPIELSPTYIIDDVEEIMDMRGIKVDKYKDEDGDPILYGSFELHQDEEQKMMSDYTLEEFGSLNNYACREYKEINGYFYNTDYYKNRKQDNPNIDDWIEMRVKNIDSAIEKSPPLIHDATFFRYGYFPTGMKVGETGKFEGYTSMTFQEKTAERFRKGYENNEEGRYKINIKAPKGTKGVLLNDTFEGVKEHEFLLQRNQRYMVLDVNDETREVTIGLYSW